MNIQLKEEMRMNGHGQDEGRTIMRRYNNCGEPGYNIRICKKNKEISNVYSFD